MPSDVRRPIATALAVAIVAFLPAPADAATTRIHATASQWKRLAKQPVILEPEHLMGSPRAPRPIPANASGGAAAAPSAAGTGKADGAATAAVVPLAVSGGRADSLDAALSMNADSRAQANVSTIPSGAAIWSHNSTWVKIRRWHPAGLVANVNSGVVVWNEVSYMSLRALLMLSCVCWPAIVIAIIMTCTIMVGLSLAVKPADENVEAPNSSRHYGNGGSNCLDRPLPVLSRDELVRYSQWIYWLWTLFCRCIPSIFVFGLPILLIVLSRPYPQEVFSMLSLMTSMMMFSNGIWVVIFGGSSIIRMRYCMLSSSVLRSLASRSTKPNDNVKHWVILPQYKEDAETVSMALRSIAMSSVAKSSIGIVLGMEQREDGAREKAETLRSAFREHFLDIVVTYHPKDLLNDPPGKASNVAWAFKRLLDHVDKNEASASPVVLTVADADSEFHHEYFEGLTHMYRQAADDRKDNIIWQAPVFHVKNYHRQPYPIIVGTMFTCMQELAALSDPHSIRFPYSTYSMSMELAKTVGGWDPEWIAEDWHMGIKCFLMTLGKSRVEPLLLPVANYTPEDTTMWKTILARWAQAKRHALGFSDVAYYFMMLPLVFGNALSKGANTNDHGRIQAMRQVWYMIFSGLTLVIRLTNVHVIIGVLMTYGALGLVLKTLMVVLLTPDRHVDFLFDKMHFNVAVLTVSSVTCMIVTTLLFNGIYILLRTRMEGAPFKWISIHWCYSMVAFAIFGPIYFLALGVAVWKAAISMLVQTSFEYEVASKPTTENRLS